MESGIWCIMFTGRTVTDDIRDAFFQQAYLMICQDLRELESMKDGAWMRLDEEWEDLPSDRIRENPIRKVAHGMN